MLINGNWPRIDWRHFGWLCVVLISLLAPTAALAQTSTPAFAGVYKAWSMTPEGKALDSTLYLNLDGSALLVDDALLGAVPVTRTGRWAPGGTGVILTLTNTAAGPLPQPIVVNLDASAGQPLVTLPGDTALDGRGWRFYATSYLAENRQSLSYNADIAAATIAANGLAGAYKAIVPDDAGGWSEVTLTLFPDFRVVLERDALDGRSPSLTYGAWQDVGGQPLLTLTEADGVPFPAPVELSFTLEGGLLRGQSTAAGSVADLVGVPFLRLEGLANAVAVLAPGEVSAPTATLPPGDLTSTAETLAVTLTTSALQYEPVFEAAPCPAELAADAAVTCGYLTVPENRSRADSSSIRLFVVTLAAEQPLAADPLLVLADDASADPSTLIQWFATAPVRATRNVILLHPRGAGLSEPSLTCPDYLAGADRQAAMQSLADCRNRLNAEVRDLAGYSLDQSVIDVADLAQALALEQVNLLGNGIGAALAQLVADRYPALVRSVVLESPLPAGVNGALEAPFGAYGALRGVLAACGRDAACAAAYPDLENRFLAVIDWYNQHPTPASLGFGDGNAIAALIFDQLEQGGGSVPALIDAFYTGNYGVACQLAPVAGGCLLPVAGGIAPAAGITATETLTGSAPLAPVGAAPAQWRDYFTSPDNPTGAEEATLARIQSELGLATRAELLQFLDALAVENFLPLLSATGAPTQTTSILDGARLSIACAEDASRYTIADVQRLRQRLPSQLAGWLTTPAVELLDACSLWVTPPAAPGDRVIHTITAPALILAGADDPVTPARWARRAAADFAQPFVRILVDAGHNLLQAPDSCAQQVLAAFVATPDKAPNFYCARSRPPTFVLPAP